MLNGFQGSRIAIRSVRCDGCVDCLSVVSLNACVSRFPTSSAIHKETSITLIWRPTYIIPPPQCWARCRMECTAMDVAGRMNGLHWYESGYELGFIVRGVCNTGVHVPLNLFRPTKSIKPTQTFNLHLLVDNKTPRIQIPIIRPRLSLIIIRRQKRISCMRRT